MTASARDTAVQFGPTMSRSEITPLEFATASVPTVSDGPTVTRTRIVRAAVVPSGTGDQSVV